MSTGWTIYIAIFSIVNVLACLWLLWWTSKHRAASPSDGAEKTTGHEWDGIREYNTPLPRWWLNLFYLTIIFALVYFALYPALGSFAGTRGWSSAAQHDADALAADARIRPLYAAFAEKPLEALIDDADAQRLGRSVFANHCATCHGSDAKGAKGFPNLTDQDWLWGGAPETVLTTILEGRSGAMPAMGAAIGEEFVPAVAVYVQSLSGLPADAHLVAQGEAKFQMICSACHGADGRGNPLLGAPNLTDNVWLYGSDFNTIAESIRLGRHGMMPAHAPLIGEDKVRLAAAWVLAQSKKESTDDHEAR